MSAAQADVAAQAARAASRAGRALPDDPYMLNWYEGKLRDIFSAVDGDVVYKELYGPFSEYHHWRIGGFGQLVKFSEREGTFTMTTESPSLTATALASAFQCLWQTLSALEEIVPGGIRDDLDRQRQNYVNGHQQTG